MLCFSSCVRSLQVAVGATEHRPVHFPSAPWGAPPDTPHCCSGWCKQPDWSAAIPPRAERWELRSPSWQDQTGPRAQVTLRMQRWMMKTSAQGDSSNLTVYRNASGWASEELWTCPGGQTGAPRPASPFCPSTAEKTKDQSAIQWTSKCFSKLFLKKSLIKLSWRGKWKILNNI